MPNLTTAVGTFFEERLLAAIPGLKDFRDCDNVPDFKLKRTWLEAKVALDASDYGVVPKPYQLAYHDQFVPLLYICGYHDFAEATLRLKQKTQRGMVSHLDRNASINRVFIVSPSIISSIWSREARYNRIRTQEYCRISGNDLRHIVDDVTITRKGVQHSAREYYGIEDCVYRDANPIGYVLTRSDARHAQNLLRSIDCDVLLR